MAPSKPADPKTTSLRRHGALNPRPQAVRDELFVAGGFFDRRDLVQVRYEMLRRVLIEGRPISETATRFGVSRPTYYAASASFEGEGLCGLLPRKRGPKGRPQAEHRGPRGAAGCPRRESIGSHQLPGRAGPEALRRRGPPQDGRARAETAGKKTPVIEESRKMPESKHALVRDYEELRAATLAATSAAAHHHGLALLTRSGMAAWMQAWSSCAASTPPARTKPAVRMLAPPCPEVVAVLAQMAIAAAQEVST